MTRDVAGILHFLTREQMAAEIVRLDAVVVAQAAVMRRIREGIAADRCDGEGGYAAGVNAACRNHLAFVDTVIRGGRRC